MNDGDEHITARTQRNYIKSGQIEYVIFTVDQIVILTFVSTSRF
mgnify:CR=1 FL=1